MTEEQFVVFGLGKMEFGINIERVREIVRLQNITKIPQSPDFVEGIVNLRGQIVPIIDLCMRFLITNIEESKESQRSIIVVNLGEQDIGILVDSVTEILRVSDDSIEPAPTFMARGISLDFVRGVAKVENRLIITLDLDRIFTFEEKKMLERELPVV